MSKSSSSSSESSSSSSSQTSVDPDFDQRFATSFVNFCIAESGNNADNLKKLILIAPLRESAPGIVFSTEWKLSVVWNSMKSGFSEAERPRAGDDEKILDLYLRNLDAIKENLTAKIAPLANINDAQRASIAEAFEILENVKSHDPQISLNKIIYDAKEDGTASMIRVNLGMDGAYYYGEVKYQSAGQNISSHVSKPVEIIEGKGTLVGLNGTYVGDFINGERTGKGILTYQDGNKYVGNFANNVRSGEGTLTRKDGSIIRQGHWDNNDLLESSISNEIGFGIHGNDDATNSGTVPHSPTVRRVREANKSCVIS